MVTIQKISDPFRAATIAVDRQIELNGGDVAVHPLVAQMRKDFPRHGAQELSAAVITAIALRGAAMCWDVAAPRGAAA